ncbi:MAG: coenzyme F420-0:L-glutamate ligase [Candidatus Bathyarchaeota archaeon]|nr:coenzyme F420-0:L-glutamate ligase [Candidatus Bathyarchaeota archaeon]
MIKLKILKIQCKYWKPGLNLVETLTKLLQNHVRDGDFIVLSEKAYALTLGYIFDEARIKPNLFSKIFVYFWMRLVWGYILSLICKLKPQTIKLLRSYPIVDGASHKQLALKASGLLSALKPISEGGIDGSNLPYKFVTLPIKNIQEEVNKLRRSLEERLGVNLNLMVVDSDRIYVYRRNCRVIFSTRKTCFKEIKFLGFLAYIVGRSLRSLFKPLATPLAYSGGKIKFEDILIVAEAADRVRGHGAGRTVFEVAETFNVPVSCVTWEMLEKVRHYPVILVRKLD